MTQKHKIQLFEDRQVRTVWDDEQQKWFFSIVDVCGVLAESDNPQVYWRVLKSRLKKEGNETVTNCNALKRRDRFLFHVPKTSKISKRTKIIEASIGMITSRCLCSFLGLFAWNN